MGKNVENYNFWLIMDGNSDDFDAKIVECITLNHRKI